MKKSKFIKYNKLEQEDYEINSYIYDDCDIEDLTYFDIMNVRKNENGFFMDLGIDKMIIVYNVFYPTYYVEKTRDMIEQKRFNTFLMWQFQLHQDDLIDSTK